MPRVRKLWIGWWVDGSGWCPTRRVLEHCVKNRGMSKRHEVLSPANIALAAAAYALLVTHDETAFYGCLILASIWRRR
jgi:hypothetical protein